MMPWVVAGRRLQEGLPGRKILFAASLTATFAASVTAMDVYAKGPDFYAPLTVSIEGRSGDRSFDASGGADGQAVWEFVQQVADPSDSPVPARTVSSPGLTDSYELHFSQGPTANMKLPWTGMPTARFYYYPARERIPAHVRLRLARESEAAHDTWVLAKPSLVAMVERHARGLAPDGSERQSLSLASLGIGAGCILAAFLLVIAVARRKGMPWATSSKRATVG